MSLPTHPPTHLPSYLSIYLSIYLSLSLCIYLSIYLSVCVSIRLSIYLSIHQLTCCSVAESSYSKVDQASQRSQDVQCLYEFDHFRVPGGSFWAQGWMPEAILKDRGSSHAKCYKNDAKIAAQGHLWEHIGALKGLLSRPWAQYARHFASFGWYF